MRVFQEDVIRFFNKVDLSSVANRPSSDKSCPGLLFEVPTTGNEKHRCHICYPVRMAGVSPHQLQDATGAAQEQRKTNKALGDYFIPE